jgi:hypothetical protein
MSPEQPQGANPGDGARVDRALRDGFADAIRRHRDANLPMAIWENEQVRLVSPFDLPLPGEPPAGAAERPEQGAD